ncbi:MAG: DUF4160 domain-containing protein [Pirellulales bacterium]
MPTISRFFGISIRMYHNEHAPPHFHAHYGNQRAVIDIETLAPRRGKLPRRVLGMVVEWAVEHREELMANWELAQLRTPLNPIEPLE